MARSLTIKPIEIKYDTTKIKTMQSSLAAHNLYRAPGTYIALTPSVDASGKYRTGVDPHALYVNKLEGEARKAELAMIETLHKELKREFGEDVDFGPKSQIWNAFSEQDLKVQIVRLGNDAVVIDTSTPQGLLTYCWVRVDPRLAKSLESFYNKECPDCRYYIENVEAENRLKYSQKKEANATFRKFEDLTPSRRKDIAILMGLPVTENTKEEVVYNLVDSAVREGNIKDGEYKGKSAVKLLKEFLEMTPEHIEMRNLVGSAIRYNVYRNYDGRIEEGGITLAPSKEDLVHILLDPKNAQMRAALEMKIQAKKESLS